MQKFRRVEENFIDTFKGRIKLLILIIIFIYGILVFSFWRVQIHQGNYFKELAVNNRIRSVVIQPPRGHIYDKNGIVLADNRPSFDVEVMIEDVPKDKQETIASGLSGILNIPKEKILKTIQRSKRVPYVPEKITRDINIAQLTEIQETRDKFPGINVNTVPMRDYKFDNHASHILGYLNKISQSEYAELKAQGYYIQDYIGRMGIEKTMEQYLKGEHGGMQVQVDHRGYTDKVLGVKDPLPGGDVYLTIDHYLQEKAESLIQDKAGAIVVMDPRNGNILAMASSPSFDPNSFVKPTPKETIRKLFKSKKKYLVNRAIREQYPPGSTFKLLVAIAALEKGIINIRSYYGCSGQFYLGDLIFKCWFKWGHGSVNVIDAIRYSCNVFFYNVGHRLKVKDIHKWGVLFGFGQKTGIDLDAEVAGVNPSNEWKKRTIGEPFYPGDMINLAIGQGYMLVTPLQVACYLSALANGGYLYRPRLVDKVVSNTGKIIKSFPITPKHKIDISDKTFKIIRQGMYEVVNHAHGTGSKAKVKGYSVSGKTGTIQVGTVGNYKTHVWFIGFAPSEEPEIAVTIFLEFLTSGGTDAAPISSEIMDFYFQRKNQEALKMGTTQ